MSANQQILFGGGSGTTTVDIGDTIANSCMFDSASSQYMSKTFGSAGNRRTFTISMWVKRCKLGATQSLAQAAVGGSEDRISFNSDDTLWVGFNGVTTYVKTSAVYRDTGAWMHIVVRVDTTDATAANRIRLYVNGTETTYASTSYMAQNYDCGWNNAVLHEIGRAAGAQYSDLYIASYVMVDGSSLAPSSFGRTSADTGAWVPKTHSVTYGTNGVYFAWANSASMGTDSSGNGHTFTLNSITSANQYTDTPTNNYPTWNKLSTVTTGTLSAGNTKVAASGIAISGVGMQTSGRYYWEIASSGGTTTVGMYTTAATTTITVASGKTYGLRFDVAAGTFDYINITDAGSWTAITTGLTGGPYFFYVSTAAATTATLNPGSRAFVGSVPATYTPLSTANLPTQAVIDPSDHFFAKIRTGTGAAYSVSGLNFQPDLVWVKGRSGATDHALYDAVRGVQKQLESNTTTDESTEATGLTAFNSDGYSGGTLAQMNTNTATYIDWMWKANGAGSSNAVGSITATVSTNTTAGVAIGIYTGTGANATIGHGLGVAPRLIGVKARTTAGADTNWGVYHASNTAAPETDYLLLNSNAATADLNTYWNDTAPTTTVFSISTHADVNTSGDAYEFIAFAEIEGFSKFGSYTGNGSADGPFLYCGFRPRWIMAKRSDGASNWHIVDAARNTYNVASERLFADSPSALDAGDTVFDFCANGAKMRSAAAGFNTSGGTYIFAAFAEFPFKYATAR